MLERLFRLERKLDRLVILTGVNLLFSTGALVPLLSRTL